MEQSTYRRTRREGTLESAGVEGRPKGVLRRGVGLGAARTRFGALQVQGSEA